MAANVNNYVAAGRAAVNANNKIRTALAKGKPQVDKIANAAITANAREKAQAMQNNRAVAQTAMNEIAKGTNTTREIDSDKKIAGTKKKARMAGMLAGGAALIGVGAMQMNKKEEENEMLGMYKDMADKYRQRADDARTKYNEINSSSYEGSANTGSDGQQTTGDTAGQNTGTSAEESTASPLSGAQSDGWSRWSRVISAGEGTSGDAGYTTMFGHRKFTDMSKHPNSPMATPWGTQSEAAGKYQFMKPTWDRAAGALGLKDFSRESQEKAGQWLATQRGLDFNTRITDFNTFKTEITKIAPEWASMPSAHKGGKSHYGQGAISFEKAWEIYNQ